MSGEKMTRASFNWFFVLQTRWSDNDMYGHINNAKYYSYLDTVMSEFLIQGCQFHIEKNNVISVVASSQCDYFQSISYPSTIHIGISIEHIGTKSVRYMIGFFKDEEDTASAVARLTEVWLDKESGTSISIPEQLKVNLKKYTVH